MHTPSPRIGVVGVPSGWSSQRLADALAARTGFRCLIDMQDVAVDMEHRTVRCGALDLMDLDALVIKKIGHPYSPDLLDRLAMLRFVGHHGLPIFSDPAVVKGLVDRLSGTVSLHNAGVPLPPTTITENLDEAVAAVNRYGRAVLKPLYTSKARGMMVVEAGSGLRDEIARYQEAGNLVLYVQRLLPELHRDLGVVFLGGEYLGCYARVRGKSWNTTTDSGGRYAPHEPKPAVVELARKAHAVFNLDFTCVDVAETPDGPLVFEVSAFGGFRGLLEACGIDAAGRMADYVLQRVCGGGSA